MKNENKFGFIYEPDNLMKNVQYIEISVQDTGIGIEKENSTKLFSSFEQLDSSFTRKHEETGLGLALVKKFVELHNGTIVVDSEPGKGSKFTFWIPWR